jgi:uncharacterized protein (DUF1810 family)
MITATRSIARFHAAQGRVYPQVIREIRRGVKETHWMWFIFPQHIGLARSEMAHRFGIKDKAEALAYLDNVTLRTRLHECTTGILAQKQLMFGDTDRRKLRSCMTLFREVVADPTLPDAVLGKFYGGELDQRTLDLLAGKPITITDAYVPGREPVAVSKHWEKGIARARATVAEAALRRDHEPWSRERVLSFARGFGLSSVAVRQIADAWMADQSRARRQGWDDGHEAGLSDGWDQAQ